MTRVSNIGIALTATLIIRSASAYVLPGPKQLWGSRLSSTTIATDHHEAQYSASSTSTTAVEHSNDDAGMAAVRAPLKYIGSYPCLALTFPDLSTPSQRQRNVSGVSLDFVLDTGANMNTINGQVAKDLGLNETGWAPTGIGSSGPIVGNLPTFWLGNAKLEGQAELFLTGLTASALLHASPAAGGLLSLAFLQSFSGGVDFFWGSVKNDDGNVQPSVTFYSGIADLNHTAGLHRVAIQRIPMTELPCVTVKINGVEMQALLDTGSPITVLNSKAAKLAGIDTIDQPETKSKNPLAALSKHFQIAKAGSTGQVLKIFGASGELVNLIQSRDKVSLGVKGTDEDIWFGNGHVYVGDLPALEGLGASSPPAVILGLDALQCRPHMLLLGQKNEVWF
jgi:hypothetical protein